LQTVNSYNTSMMYEYYNPNPQSKAVGDCVIRALCKALDKPWAAVYTELCVYGMAAADMPSANAVWGAYLRAQGYRRYIIPDTCPDCYTISNFAADHPDGVYIVGTGSHVVTVSDGVIFDSWDSSNEIPIFYFKKEGR